MNKTRIFLSGASGRMGLAITDYCQKAGIEIVAGLGIDKTSKNGSYPLYSSFDLVPADLDFDVLIDFSSFALAKDLRNFIRDRQCPAVIGTTAYSEEDEKALLELSSDVPIFRSSNMSIGVYVLNKLVKEASRLLDGHYDVEIIEKHHRWKKDQPSGTALTLQESLGPDRSSCPIHSVRIGAIAGDHEVLFASDEEIISLSHHAENRSVFARGAVEAALFLKNRKPGFYTMDNLLS